MKYIIHYRALKKPLASPFDTLELEDKTIVIEDAFDDSLHIELQRDANNAITGDEPVKVFVCSEIINVQTGRQQQQHVNLLILAQREKELNAKTIKETMDRLENFVNVDDFQKTYPISNINYIDGEKYLKSLFKPIPTTKKPQPETNHENQNSD